MIRRLARVRHSTIALIITGWIALVGLTPFLLARVLILNHQANAVAE